MLIKISSNSGMETATKLELKKLGIEAPCINGSFVFDGTSEDVIRLNYLLRTAERVFVELKSFKATSFDELFDGIYDMDWKEFIPKNASVIVNAKSVKSTVFALSAIQSVCKKAIVKKLVGEGTLKETGNEIRLLVSILSDEVSVLLDTSGQPLHKRGYRDLVWKAPIKETLAAAVILLSVWNKERPFADPFCGSGTIPIEAALIAKNIPAGYLRNFAFEDYPIFDKDYFKTLKKECEDKIDRNYRFKLFGSDIDKKAVNLSDHHAKNAGVDDILHFEKKDVKDFCSTKPFGVIVTNPPYGQRLLEEKELIPLYKTLYKTYSSLPDWCMYVISGYQDFERAFGKKADVYRKFFNSDIQVGMYGYLSSNRPMKK